MILENTDRSNLFGVFRPIRSDEYVVFTEMALSQVKTGFKWFSDVWGYSPSDMFIVYGQPVLNPVTIFRPFTLGYIFLGDEMGLAFYWSSRFAVCFLVSFEFGRYITKNDNILSFLYSVMVVLSPVIQWWYSINELVEIIIFGQGAIIIVILYLNTDSFEEKIILAVLFLVCAGGFVLSFYPAWAIPSFYVFLFFGIATLMENSQKLINKKIDTFLLFTLVLILVLSFLYIWSNSKETISAIINTVYPGIRNEKGALINVVELFRGWTSFLWTIIEINNPCEEVDFISLFPLGIVLAFVVLFKQKENDILLKYLLICNIFLIAFLIIRLPDWFTSITMMRNVTHGRNVIVIGYLNLIILIRAMSKIKQQSLWVCLFVPGLLSLFIGLFAVEPFLNNTQSIFVIFVGVLQIALLIEFCKGEKKGFIALALSLSIIGGALVNPVNTGLDSIYETEVYKAIESINKKDDGLWVVVNGGISLNDFPTIAGAHTINAVSTYPDFEFWKKIGMEDKKELWNRYAHLNILISDKENLEQITADALKLSIKLNTIKDLGVKYILSYGEIQDETDLAELFNYSNIRIYSFR